jgi:hypothetical protein
LVDDVETGPHASQRESNTHESGGFDKLLGMSNYELIALLQAERHRIDAVIKLLSDPSSATPAKTPRTTRKERKPLSAAARKRMSEAQKKRWAEEK